MGGAVQVMMVGTELVQVQVQVQVMLVVYKGGRVQVVLVGTVRHRIFHKLYIDGVLGY